MNWMLDLIDYEALDMARTTVELRREDQKRMAAQSSDFVVWRYVYLVLPGVRALERNQCSV
jgi:hypothetical protein